MTFVNADAQQALSQQFDPRQYFEHQRQLEEQRQFEQHARHQFELQRQFERHQQQLYEQRQFEHQQQLELVRQQFEQRQFEQRPPFDGQPHGDHQPPVAASPDFSAATTLTLNQEDQAIVCCGDSIDEAKLTASPESGIYVGPGTQPDSERSSPQIDDSGASSWTFQVIIYVWVYGR